VAQPLHMPALLAWQTEFRRSEVAYAASISLDDIPRKTGAASVGFKRVFGAPAYNDWSFWTTHRAPQIAAEADHPRAQRPLWLAEACHIRGREARGLPLFARYRSLPSAPSAQARLALGLKLGDGAIVCRPRIKARLDPLCLPERKKAPAKDGVLPGLSASAVSGDASRRLRSAYTHRHRMSDGTVRTPFIFQ
jgi:hypothetical protein